MGFRRRELNKKLMQGTAADDETWGRDDPESIVRAKGLRVKTRNTSSFDEKLYFLVLFVTFLVVGGFAVKLYLDNTEVHRSRK
jgi:hypothetical protein